MSSQRRSERARSAALGRVLALPPSVQRRMAGRPVRRDGQTLDPQVQLVLRLQRVAREPGPETLPVPAGRLAVDRQARTMGGSPPIGVLVERTVAGLPARIYLPAALAASSEPRPTLLYLHGGGFVYGGLEAYDAVCRFLAERAGVQVVLVDYRLAPEHVFPAAHDDAITAYDALVADADDLRVDTARLAVGGDSAGGNLAAAVAAHAARKRLPLAFQMLVYPVTDPAGDTVSRRLFGRGFYLTTEFMDLAVDSYLPEPADRLDPRVAPLHGEVPAGVAPAYVVTAGFDPLRDEGEAYARKLADAGVAVELRRHDGLVHGFLNWLDRGEANRTANLEVAAALAAGVKSV
ncbi:alpha/beta hydrolase [Nocardioides guangzhouensis]|uniref:Alpha/beta hydrolase n=1 Tax=Nocardioides guangzhouensis TaxID=2497878 RepID=A0A4Q4ZCY2_9ACTN|nr:alpha/beta hydrolase [Nocardioides guangzhouensis]RYP85186.1 alpha/beta hydrolase [Nocardioides guangzhouensis]